MAEIQNRGSETSLGGPLYGLQSRTGKRQQQQSQRSPQYAPTKKTLMTKGFPVVTFLKQVYIACKNSNTCLTFVRV